jgi:hypothetical protein
MIPAMRSIRENRALNDNDNGTANMESNITGEVVKRLPHVEALTGVS